MIEKLGDARAALNDRERSVLAVVQRDAFALGEEVRLESET